MGSYYYSGTISVPTWQRGDANEIIARSKFVISGEVDAVFRPDGQNAVFDIGEATDYRDWFDLDDYIEELFNDFLDHGIHADIKINYTGDFDGGLRNRGDKFLRLDTVGASIFDASDKELIDELKARGVWQKYVKEKN